MRSLYAVRGWRGQAAFRSRVRPALCSWGRALLIVDGFPKHPRHCELRGKPSTAQYER